MKYGTCELQLLGVFGSLPKALVAIQQSSQLLVRLVAVTMRGMHIPLVRACCLVSRPLCLLCAHLCLLQ